MQLRVRVISCFTMVMMIQIITLKSRSVLLKLKQKAFLKKDYTNWQTTALVNLAENEATVKSAFWWSKMLPQKFETML
jgi:hypothetical protein